MSSEHVVVDGRFELLEPLGVGGMGTVWRALDLALHREVALKEVRSSDPDDTPSAATVQRERVLREARALARISHPNVVAIHHIVDSSAEEHPWIVMELVRGPNLAEVFKSGPMHPAQVAQIGRGILAALRAAHAVGVLHRDIKPANIILRADGSPVLTDFGIAAIHGMTGLTATGSVVGSVDYVAPERVHGQEGNPASDLWSLGLVLYVAVEGYHPMRRDNSVATLAAVLKGEVPAPQRAGPLTPALRALLVSDPNLRPPANQLDWMLSEAITAPTAVTRPAAPSDSRPHRSRRVLVGLAAVTMTAAVVVAIVVAVTLWPKSTESHSAAADSTSAVPSTGQTQDTPTTESALPSTTTDAINTGAAQPTDLLTPTGLRQAITALEQATGGQDFTDTTIYPDYINTGAPVKGQPTHYDSFNYRDGAGSRIGPGGDLTGKATIKLRSIDWDVLPALLNTAQQKLGIPKPTSRYVIINPAWDFNNDQPAILVYLADDYGSAYLAANTDGTVIRLYPK